MSAGGLSYSGLVNHGKITLPSVDSWGNNMNILRDPPKSIMTKRIDKVGETSSMTQMIEESSSRASEAIQVYARGVNPFVSVSYDNNGNNGGQSSGSFVEGGQRSAKLPYTIMKDGAFRPPILLQEDLLPLSRIPRENFSVLSKPGFADFSRRVKTCGTAENTKEVKTDTLKACVRPTAVYKIERPASQPYEIKHVIQPSIKTSAVSGIRTMDITQKYNGNPTKEIDTTPLHAKAQANFTHIRHMNNNVFNPQRYLQEPVSYNVASNISSIKNNVGNNEINTGIYLQEPLSYNVTSNISSIMHNIANNDFNPERYLQQPVSYNVASNISSIKNNVGNNELNTQRYLQEPVSYNVASNISAIKNNVGNNEINPQIYLQEPVSYNVSSNISSKNNHTLIEDIFDTSNIPVYENIRHYSLIAPFSGLEQTKYFHDDISLSRTLPEYNVTTNFGNQTVYKRTEYDNQIELSRNTPITSLSSNPSSRSSNDNSSRDAHLRDKIKPGGYSIPAQIPMKVRLQNIPDQKESEKARMNRIVTESMQGRFDKPSPFQKVG
jgi:hypothetical protein